jgi:hypothetical protein
MLNKQWAYNNFLVVPTFTFEGAEEWHNRLAAICALKLAINKKTQLPVGHLINVDILGLGTAAVWLKWRADLLLWEFGNENDVLNSFVNDYERRLSQRSFVYKLFCLILVYVEIVGF